MTDKQGTAGHTHTRLMAGESFNLYLENDCAEFHDMVATIWVEPWSVIEAKNLQARIVACVNACASLPDPTALRTQRDALLAACKDAAERNRDLIGRDSITGANACYIAGTIERLNEAIALCPEGGAS